MTEGARDILRRRALEYHLRDDRKSSCGSMAIEMDLLFSGMVTIDSDARLVVTPTGKAFLAKPHNHSTPKIEPGA